MSSNIIGLFPNKSDAPSEKVKKESGPLSKKLDAPSERVKKTSGDLNETKTLLVATIETVGKKGRSEKYVVEEANNSPIS